jgi:hypothetical protein
LLFLFLCAIFAAWIGFLLVLYFKTVSGRVSPGETERSPAASAPSG